jgi:ferritin-like metal-binding protein YciE
LEKIFEVTGIKPAAEKMRCYGRNFKRSDELISKTDVGVVRDASIIASEQKLKHEITYGTLRLCKTRRNKAVTYLQYL